MSLSPAVELKGISKQFGGVYALQNVSLRIDASEIHGLIGENGAGKSTLMRILCGFYHADEGEIFIRGERTILKNPADAIAKGIGMLHQHFMLVPPLTVLENIILGLEPRNAASIDWKKARAEINALIEQSKIPLNPDTRIEQLSVGLQQQVEILKLLYRKAETLILDEPTAVLTPQETERLFSVLRELRAQGKTIAIITHKMAEILALTDRVTVLRSGKNVGERETKATSRPDLAQLMVGREIELRVMRPPMERGKEVLKVTDLCAVGDRGESALNHVTFNVHEGEIVGIAGVMGNGQSELEEVLTGLRPLTSGSIELIGQSLGHLSVRDIRRLGMKHLPEPAPIGHVPEDRQHRGLILPWNLEDNLLLGQHDLKKFNRGPFLDRAHIATHAENLIQGYDVRPPKKELSASALSGGNQQKLVLAREFDGDPKFVVVAQPTRGVDIGAIEFIHKKILELRSRKTAVLLISAELEEILTLSDRILVLYHGQIMGEVSSDTAKESDIGLMMMGSQAA